MRERIAIWLFADAGRATEVGLIGFAILIGLLAYAQTALWQGLRKISDLGCVTVNAPLSAASRASQLYRFKAKVA